MVIKPNERKENRLIQSTKFFIVNMHYNSLTHDNEESIHLHRSIDDDDDHLKIHNEERK